MTMPQHEIIDEYKRMMAEQDRCPKSRKGWWRKPADRVQTLQLWEREDNAVNRAVSELVRRCNCTRVQAWSAWNWVENGPDYCQ